MLLCSIAMLRRKTGSRQCTEVKDKVFHALANLGIPLSNRQEIAYEIFLKQMQVITLYISLFILSESL